MPLIVDTMNVLHVTGVLPPDLAGLELADLPPLVRISRFRDQHVTFVCDGHGTENPLPASHPLISVKFSGRGRTADDVIAQLVKRSSTPRRTAAISGS